MSNSTELVNMNLDRNSVVYRKNKIHQEMGIEKASELKISQGFRPAENLGSGRPRTCKTTRPEIISTSSRMAIAFSQQNRSARIGDRSIVGLVDDFAAVQGDEF